MEGLPAQSLEILEEGFAFHPGLPSAMLCKARCLFDLKRYSEALKTIDSILNKNAENIRALKLRAEISIRLGQKKAAVLTLRKVVLLFPQDKDALKSLEELSEIESKAAELIPPESRRPADEKLGEINEFKVEPVRKSFSELIDVPNIPAPKVELQKVKYVENDEEPQSEPTFATRTIAELYLRQGLTAKAKKVLRRMISDEPSNKWAREALQELETDGIVLPETKNSRPIRLEKKAKVLERILAQFRQRRRELH